MAIHPYPHELIQHYQLTNGVNITIRPIRPEDAMLQNDFVERLSERTKFFRFMQALHELTPEMIVRFTQIDYDREMAFLAISTDANMPNELGVGRYMRNPDGHSAEFALVVADDCHCLGIGSRLMKTLMQTAKDKGITVFEAEILSNNAAMLGLVKKLGFSIETVAGNSEIVRAVKDLRH
jgi:acetyltransferase